MLTLQVQRRIGEMEREYGERPPDSELRTDDMSDQPATTRRAGHSKLYGRPLDEDGNIELRVESAVTAASEPGEPPPLDGAVWYWRDNDGDWRCLTANSHYVYCNGEWLRWQVLLTVQERRFVATLAELRSQQLALRARVEVLTALVETSHREGWREGFAHANARARGAAGGYTNAEPDEAWETSDARKALLAGAERKDTIT